MADKDKVIKELQRIADIINQYDDMLSVDNVDSWVILDALALLKEDEPVKAKYHRESYYHGAYYECGKCGYDFGTKKPKVCPNCNRVVT